MLIPQAIVQEGGGGLFSAYAYLRDEKAANTSGGSTTSGSWQTRTLNTEVFDTGGIVSLAANQFSLGAGTYYISAQAPFSEGDRTKLKIRNITDGSDALIGVSTYCSSATPNINTIATVRGRITIADTKTFELQYQVATSEATFGLGIESNFGVVEVYAEVEIWKEA